MFVCLLNVPYGHHKGIILAIRLGTVTDIAWKELVLLELLGDMSS